MRRHVVAGLLALIVAVGTAAVPVGASATGAGPVVAPRMVAAPAGCPPHASICNPAGGLQVLAASDEAAGIVSVGARVVATAAPAPGVTGISLAQGVVNTSGAAAAVGLTSWFGAQVTSAEGGPVGLEGQPSLPGWSPASFYTYAKPVADITIAVTSPVSWDGVDPYGERAVPTMTFSWHASASNFSSAGSSSGGQFLFNARCERPGDGDVRYVQSWLPYGQGGGYLHVVAHNQSISQGGNTSAMTKAVNCPSGYAFESMVMQRNDSGMGQPTSDAARDALIAAGKAIVFRTPGNPDAARPSQQGRISQTLRCMDGNGVVTVRTQDTSVTLFGGDAIEIPELTCGPGEVVAGFGATWTPAANGVTQTLVPDTTTPDWVHDTPTQYPECVAGECALELYRALLGGAVETCGILAADCPLWYLDVDRASNYVCQWGPYRVPLSICSVFRDPGTLRHNSEVGPDGTVVTLDWPPLELDSVPIATLIHQLGSMYGDQACTALAEAARNAAPGTSVPDVMAVCEGRGVSSAVVFATLTSTHGLAAATAILVAATATTLDLGTAQPDCEQVNSAGDCLDEGEPGILTLEDITDEPEPEPAGTGIPPRKNCLDDQARRLLEDSMPDQWHHMATRYGEWAQDFQDILDERGVGLSLNDAVHAWNVHRMPHRGPHPAEYHQWVYENLQKIAREIDIGDTEAFIEKFNRYIVEPTLSDPTIVRVAYWKCYRSQ